MSPEEIRHKACELVLSGKVPDGFPDNAQSMSNDALLLSLKQVLTERALLFQYIQSMSAKSELILEKDDQYVIRFLDSLAVHFINSAYAKLLGCRKENLTGRQLTEVCERKDTAQLEDAVRGILRNDGQDSFVQQCRRGRQVIWIRWRLSLVEAKSTGTMEVLCIGTDITESVLMEERFQQVEKLESLGTLAGTLAHDLNNCIAPVRLGAQMLHRAVQDKASTEILDMIENSIDHADDIVDQISSFARGYEGESKAIQLGKVLTDLKRVTKRSFPRNMSLEVDLPKNLPPVFGNYTQLYQIFINLCLNSKDAMPEGGTITISGDCTTLSKGNTFNLNDGRYVKCTIKDSGEGIEEENLSHIFEPYFTTKPDGKGTGLGLPSVQHILRSHGGAVAVESERGSGTTFTIYLPVCAELETDASSAEDTATIGHGQEVLVVDDDRPIRQMTAEMLRFRGFTVTQASSGEECLEYLRTKGESVSLVVIDMFMQGIDGIETSQRLKKTYPALKILLMTGAKNSPSQEKDRKEMGLHLLHKPFREGDLLWAIRKMMQ